MLHIPILRAGVPYCSKETVPLCDYATGEQVATMSMANPGLISRDLRADRWTELQSLSMREILDRMQVAADHFMNAELAVGDDRHTPEQFVAAQSATTGLPHALCEANMKKIEAGLRNMEQILEGLTGGLDLETLDAGYGMRDGHVVSYAPCAKSFGAVLPANSPGVHALWLPAVALKTPLALKPGRKEPWTPLRIIEALRQAGLPDAAFGFYPSGHDGSGIILTRTDRSMVFGAGSTVETWKDDSRVEIHGPGYSKILFGPDRMDRWEDDLELCVTSVAANGGRSCINASSIRVSGDSEALADALAQRLVSIEPRRRDDPEALLAAFTDPAIASGINAAIERDLREPGAEDVTARYRQGERLVESDGGTYLLPTVIHCQDVDHPLANQEYLFPFVSVVNVAVDRLTETLGPSLVLTALTEDPQFERDLLARHDIGRLNFGPIPTGKIQWDQPHEGNLFEHLFTQRAFQREAFAGV